MALFDDVMKLIDAGYTKDDIDNMLAPGGDPAPKDPAASQEPEAGKPTESPELSALRSEIQNLTTTIAAMQAQAVKQAEQTEGGEMSALDAVRGFFGDKGGSKK